VDDRKLARLHRRLMASESAQAVVRLPNEKFALMPTNSPRLVSILDSALWSARVVGVFAPSVDYSVLCAEVR